MNNLPLQDTVETREGKDWGLTRPLAYDSAEFKEVFEDTMMVSQLAKEDATPWDARVIKLLRKYTPWDLHDDIPSVMAEFGINSWRESVDLVKDDECVENFAVINKWSKRNNIPRKKDRDFIDGGGYGDYARLSSRGKKTMEKVFDQKYFNFNTYGTERPAWMLQRLLDCDVRCLTHYLNPGHPEDPTGHGAKDAEALEYWLDTYKPNDEQILKVTTYLSVRTHSRSGGPVHWLNSNLKAWALAGLGFAKNIFIRKDFVKSKVN